MNKKIIGRIFFIALFLSNMSFAQEKTEYNTTTKGVFFNMVIMEQFQASKGTLESDKSD